MEQLKVSSVVAGEMLKSWNVVAIRFEKRHQSTSASGDESNVDVRGEVCGSEHSSRCVLLLVDGQDETELCTDVWHCCSHHRHLFSATHLSNPTDTLMYADPLSEREQRTNRSKGFNLPRHVKVFT
jgi:hypothetical protein